MPSPPLGSLHTIPSVLDCIVGEFSHLNCRNLSKVFKTNEKEALSHICDHLQLPAEMSDVLCFYSSPYNYLRSLLAEESSCEPWTVKIQEILQKHSSLIRALPVEDFHLLLNNAISSRRLEKEFSATAFLSLQGGLCLPIMQEVDIQNKMELMGLCTVESLLTLLRICKTPNMGIGDFLSHYIQTFSNILFSETRPVIHSLGFVDETLTLSALLNIKDSPFLLCHGPLGPLSYHEAAFLELDTCKSVQSSLYRLIMHHPEFTFKHTWEALASLIGSKTEDLRQLRQCFNKTLCEIQKLVNEHQITLPTLLELVRYFLKIKPYKARAFVSSFDGNDSYLLALMRQIPAAFEFIPDNKLDVFRSLEFEEQVDMVKVSPAIFSAMTPENRILLLEIYRDMPDFLVSAVASLLEEPYLWPQIAPYLDSRRIPCIVEHSPLFSHLRLSLETSSPEQPCLWKNFLHRMQIFFASRRFEHSDSFFSTLFSLGHLSWKLIIDPSDQRFGKEVYDLGLHDPGNIEKGYFQRLKAALIWLAISYDTPEALPIVSFEDYIIVNRIARGILPQQPLLTRAGNPLKVLINHPFLNQLDSDNFAQLEQELKADIFCGSLIPPLRALVRLPKDTPAMLVFSPISSKVLFSHIEKLFADLHSQITNSSEEIPPLYSIFLDFAQKLERTHFFQDGNTRTHLLLLLVHLAKNNQQLALIDPHMFYLNSKRAVMEEYFQFVRNFHLEKHQIPQHQMDAHPHLKKQLLKFSPAPG